jgi:hypothetical protein
MTPYELRILLDLHCGMDISVTQDTALFIETMRWFMNEGWVTSAAGRAYAPTPKLDTFIRFVLSLPAPVQEWRMPEVRALKEAS